MFFDRIEAAPADPILGLTDAYKKDPNPNKVNLGVGVYQNNEGKTVILESVKDEPDALRKISEIIINYSKMSDKDLQQQYSFNGLHT